MGCRGDAGRCAWPAGNSCRAGAGARGGRRPEGIEGGAQGTRCTGVFFLEGAADAAVQPIHAARNRRTSRSVFFVPVAGRPALAPPDAGPQAPAAGARGAAECAVSRPVGSGSRFVRRRGTFCGRFSGPNVEKSLRELGISWNISYLWMQKMSFAANNIIRIS